MERTAKDLISAKLKAARAKTTLTQLEAAKEIGRPQQTLAGWESGRSQPDVETLNKLLSLYNISPNEFYGFSDNKKITLTTGEHEYIKKYRALDEHGKKVIDFILDEEYTRCSVTQEQTPEIDHIRYLRLSEQPASAGAGIYLGPESFTTISVKDNKYTDRANFAIPVSGKSMEPRYFDGDILLVSDDMVEIGNLGIFTLDGCGYVKKLGKGILISLNEDYASIPMNESIRCNGKIIGILDPSWIVEN